MGMGPDATITVIGEAMLELSRGAGDGWNLRYGGDVINTAVHLARFGDTVRIEMLDDHHRSIFGAIEQTVAPLPAGS